MPSTYRAGTPMPLVVALHGCSQTADSFRQQTKLDQLAESRGFVLAIPQQTSSANYLGCWNWFSQPNMQRGSGEPSIIAGITQTVEQQYSIDAKRVYVLGFSAGGAMANVMGATYPDVYASVGSGSGCEYNGLPCVGSPGPDPVASGTSAYHAMGSYARPMPVIVFQGDADTTVVPANGDQVVKAWLTTDGLASGGSAPSTTPLSSTFGHSTGGRFYSIVHYGDARGQELVQYWLVRGMNHAWSGGCSCQTYTDASGPDESAAMVDFFLNHPMP